MTRPSQVRRLPRAAEDRGQVTLLIIGLAVVVGLLLTVVVNATRVFLVQRSLSAAADGAALAGADALDDVAFYRTGGAGEWLPVSSEAAADAVAAHASGAGLAERFPSLALSSTVGADGTSVTVTASTVVSMPFLNVVSQQYAAGYPVTVTATARSPLLLQ